LYSCKHDRGGEASGDGAKDGKKLRSGEEKSAGNIVIYNIMFVIMVQISNHAYMQSKLIEIQ
jgi:hypothetical protein